MSADSSVENIPNLPDLSAQFVCSNSGTNEKMHHWASMVRGPSYYPPLKEVHLALPCITFPYLFDPFIKAQRAAGSHRPTRTN